ncbi:MAG: hypothetical protein RLY43_563 [Bacteroidota bacterium]
MSDNGVNFETLEKSIKEHETAENALIDKCFIDFKNHQSFEQFTKNIFVIKFNERLKLENFLDDYFLIDMKNDL